MKSTTKSLDTAHQSCFTNGVASIPGEQQAMKAPNLARPAEQFATATITNPVPFLDSEGRQWCLTVGQRILLDLSDLTTFQSDVWVELDSADFRLSA